MAEEDTDFDPIRDDLASGDRVYAIESVLVERSQPSMPNER